MWTGFAILMWLAFVVVVGALCGMSGVEGE